MTYFVVIKQQFKRILNSIRKFYQGISLKQKKKKQDSQLYIEYDSNYAKIKKKDKGINSQRQENKTPMVTLIVFEWWDFW